MRIQRPCGSLCEDGPCGARGSGQTEAGPVTLRRLRAPGSTSRKPRPLDPVLGRWGGPWRPWVVSTGQMRGELVLRGRAVGMQGLEPTWATQKLSQLHRPVPASLSCMDTGQAHWVSLERGRGGPWGTENRTLRTHSGSPAALGLLPPHLLWAHLQRSPKTSGGSSCGRWRLVGFPAQAPRSLQHLPLGAGISLGFRSSL